MHPVLIELSNGAKVSSYGAFAVLAIVVGFGVLLALGRREGLERRRLVDAALWCLIVGLLVSKLSFLVLTLVAQHADPWVWIDFLGRPRRIPRVLAFWQGGLVFYGGLAGGLGAAVLYCRRKSLPFPRFADLLIAGFAVAHVIGVLGCFLAGSCFGKAGGGGLGVSLPAGSQAFEAHASAGLLLSPLGPTYPLHPVQLYEAAVGLVIALVLLGFWGRRRFAGQIALLYLSLHSLTRLFLEVFRGDRARGFVGESHAVVGFNRLVGVDGGSPTLLSLSQLAAVGTLLVCAWLWFLVLHARAQRKRRAATRVAT